MQQPEWSKTLIHSFLFCSQVLALSKACRNAQYQQGTNQADGSMLRSCTMSCKAEGEISRLWILLEFKRRVAAASSEKCRTIQVSVDVQTMFGLPARAEHIGPTETRLAVFRATMPSLSFQAFTEKGIL